MNSKPPYSLITRLAYLMSFIALAIDGMLPAFPQISSYFGLVNQNEIQKIVFFIFLGMSVGQILFGPLSDAFGRRKVLLLGVSIFIAGSVFCIYARTFDQLLIGRVIQGFGASSCRIIGVAIIRDLFSGSEMGRIMSFIMIFFILIPAFAPSIGQAVLFFYDWHAIFKLFLVAGIFGFLWVFLKQKETLALENRNPLTIERFTKGLKDVASSKEAVGYGLSSGLVFGAMVGYLSCSQLIFAKVFDAEHLFIYIFGGIALFAGLTSYFNASLVRKYKMEKICVAGLILMTGTSGIYLLALNFFEIENNLTVALVYFSLVLSCIGFLFGNFSALALSTLGHVAGLANSMISSFQTFMSFAIGGIIGSSFNGSVNPVVIGFLLCGLGSLILTLFTNKKSIS